MYDLALVDGPLTNSETIALKQIVDAFELTDAQLLASDQVRLCPVTGLTVQHSFEAEQRLLRPLPVLPEPFDLVLTRTVHRDWCAWLRPRAMNRES